MAKKTAKLKSKKPKAKKSAPKKAASLKTAPGNATPVKTLEDLAKLSDACKDRSQTASGQIGQAVKDAVEYKNLHAGAFRVVVGWRRMGRNDSIKLRSFLDALDYYRDAMEIDDLKAGDMMQPAKPKRERKPKNEKATGEMRPIGEAAGNVVSLAGAMADAIAKDEANKNGEMVA